MINSIIIDDELKSIISLKWELSNFSKDILIKKTFTQPKKALAYLKSHHVDCIFLDVEMPDMDGFQFLKAIPERDLCVIFVTAYDSYAINAIKEHAFDYLLKPVDIDDLKDLIIKIKNYIKSKPESKNHNYRKIQYSTKQIKINVDGTLRLFMPNEILYCKSDGNYCHLYLSDGSHHLISKKLKHIEMKLIDSIFMRVHNSYNVNMTLVRSFDKTNQTLHLINNVDIPVSRSKKSLVLEKLKGEG